MIIILSDVIKKWRYGLKKYKGIILAGGAGTRFYPTTQAYSKQLINIYDKPMIYYPLSTLMMMDIKDILIISDPHTLNYYIKLFGDGVNLGMNISYAQQLQPNGIAEAFIIGEKFIGQDNVVLMLGDNVFYGDSDFVQQPLKRHQYATIFAYYVNNPQEYGIVEFNSEDKVLSLEEKPANPKSNYAIPGLYIYDNSVINITKNLKPSNRGELEITTVNQSYFEQGLLNVEKMGRGIAWLDTGTPQALLEASNFIAIIEKRQGLKIGCVEEIALRKGFISVKQFHYIINQIPNNQYRQYLERIYYEL